MAKNNSRQQDFPDCTYGNLRRTGFMPQQDLMARKTLATAEQGKKYTLDISGNKESAAFDVDGYIVKKGSKCDKLVLVKHSEYNWTEIFVELKGKDVKHAIEQLRETLKKDVFRHSSNRAVRARIVAASFPANKSNPVMENAKREFAAKPYFCELRGLKNGQKDKI